jgi:hypothetical protein
MVSFNVLKQTDQQDVKENVITDTNNANFFPTKLLPGSGHGLHFEVSVILLDTWQDSFGRVISPSQKPLPTQDNIT